MQDLIIVFQKFLREGVLYLNETNKLPGSKKCLRNISI